MATSTFIGVDALVARVMPHLEAEVIDSADELLTSIKAATPTDSTALQRSAKTSSPRVASRSVSIDIDVGEGLPRGYPVIVHQKDEIYHDDGQARFVSEPLIEHIPRHLEHVRDAGRKAF